MAPHGKVAACVRARNWLHVACLHGDVSEMLEVVPVGRLYNFEIGSRGAATGWEGEAWWTIAAPSGSRSLLPAVTRRANRRRSRSLSDGAQGVT
jgi:hypothetical protein